MIPPRHHPLALPHPNVSTCYATVLTRFWLLPKIPLALSFSYSSVSFGSSYVIRAPSAEILPVRCALKASSCLAREPTAALGRKLSIVSSLSSFWYPRLPTRRAPTPHRPRSALSQWLAVDLGDADVAVDGRAEMDGCNLGRRTLTKIRSCGRARKWGGGAVLRSSPY